ncbi:MAG: oxidoreductase [Actinomycetota bacterium]|nr:oxidoreductase [Actinomycetota bacterium]
MATWLITGCSTGLGRALAQTVLAHGHNAVVTARSVTTVEDIAAAYPDTALPLPLDVTNSAEIGSVVQQARARFGDIDVLVNNAGYGYLAAVEEGEDSEVRAMFETNFFGLAALMRRVLPGMRARGRGHIINISSIGGLLGNPSSGYYNATKFAVEGLTQAMAKEVERFGIRVTLIEPGPFRTDWAGRSIRVVKEPVDAYAELAGARRTQLRQNSGKQPGDPVRAADAIIKVAESAEPPLHLVLGKNGLDRVRETLNAFLSSMDAWEQVTLSADFPASGTAETGSDARTR